MNIRGYVICSPINTWGDETRDKWWPKIRTFGTTPQEAWILFLNKRPEDDDWDRARDAYINRGYCIKLAYMEVDVNEYQTKTN